MIWGLWAWWAIPLGLLSAYFAYSHWALNAAAYAALLEAAFDLHRFDLYRFDLYRALHFPLPANPTAGTALASQINTYLQRGTFPKDFQYDAID